MSNTSPLPFNRRQFVTSVGGLAALAAAAGTASAFAKATRPPGGRRPRIALLATEVRRLSHAQHFVDRFLEGYGWQGQHHRSDLELVSLYVEQFPEGDLAQDRVRRHGVKLCATIPEALTLGGSSLAVDGVVIIGEHGFYARNSRGQTLYPRYQYFREMAQVFEVSRRAVPVFNDKHLSTDWRECVAMVETSRRLNFPLMAGSSLPVTWRFPALEIPLGTPLTESVSICYGGVDSYDFHGLETAQCMSERRAGGETGIKSVQALRGEAVWELLRQKDTTRRLFFAALNRSFTCHAPDGFTFGEPSVEIARGFCDRPFAYVYEHLDGFRTTLFLLSGLVTDFTYAGLRTDTGEVYSCQMYLPMPMTTGTLADFFNPLVHHIENLVLTGQAPYPVERTLLTSGMTLFAMQSLYRGGTRIETSELRVNYAAPHASQFWRT